MFVILYNIEFPKTVRMFQNQHKKEIFLFSVGKCAIGMYNGTVNLAYFV